MTKPETVVRTVAEATADAVQIEVKQQIATHPWIERLVRFGIATRGIIYFVTGLLAAEAALGIGGTTTDDSGALIAIVSQPLGEVLLCILTVGLLGYALWGLIQTIMLPDQPDSKPLPPLLQRLHHGTGSLSHVGLAITAMQLLMGMGSEGDHTELWVARLLRQPFGDGLVALVGLVVIGAGMSLLWGAYSVNFVDEFKSERLDTNIQQWITQLGRFGVAARGAVFLVMGGFLLKAAVWSDPSEAEGKAGALARLLSSLQGRWVLAGIAFGLIAYALYSLVAAWYRRLPVIEEKGVGE